MNGSYPLHLKELPTRNIKNMIYDPFKGLPRTNSSSKNLFTPVST